MPTKALLSIRQVHPQDYWPFEMLVLFSNSKHRCAGGCVLGSMARRFGARPLLLALSVVACSSMTRAHKSLHHLLLVSAPCLLQDSLAATGLCHPPPARLASGSLQYLRCSKLCTISCVCTQQSRRKCKLAITMCITHSTDYHSNYPSTQLVVG